MLGNRIGLTPAAGDVVLANQGAGISVDNASSVVIKGNLVSGNASDGIQLRLASFGVVQGNFIGTNTAGTDSRPNFAAGIAVLSDCAALLIGGAGAGEGNVISANLTSNVYIASPFTPVTLKGNIIGLRADGNGILGNLGNGIHLDAGAHVIGGSLPGEGNVISGNGRGILVETDGNTIRGNLIGLDKTGTQGRGNQQAGAGQGILIADGGNNIIGGSGPGEGNIVGGNFGHGIQVNGTDTGNKIVGNFIGTNAAGASGLGNGVNGNFHAVNVAAPGTIIGGAAAGEGNIISGNPGRAVHLSNALNATVRGNWIGLAPDGVTARPNGFGVGLSGTGTNNAMILDNVISGNTTWGIAAQDNGGHTIAGNEIGTNAAGTAAVGNGQQGIILTRVINTTVGGAAAGAANVISGNGIDAILINGGNNIAVTGNLIGTNAAGTAALGNLEGVSITTLAGALSNVSVTGNTIAGTAGSGMNFFGAFTNVSVQSNRIGLQASGAGFLPNGRGISVNSSTGILIGGTAAQGNEIAGNTVEGINIFGANAGAISVFSNHVHDNGGPGIRLTDNLGAVTLGDATGRGNELADNGGAGIHLTNSDAGSVAGNSIHDNAGAGVFIEGASTGNLIGGDTAAAGNTITANASAGVAVVDGSGNRISRNAIFGNTGIAIDLGVTGATGNDPGDVDAGANGLQNAPMLAGAALVPGGNTVAFGTLQSAGDTEYRIEFFSGAAGGAQTFRGSTLVRTEVDGSTAFQLDLGALPAGETVVATATNTATGDTSELAAASAAPAVPTLTIGDAFVTETDAAGFTATFNVTLSASPLQDVSVDYSTLSGTAVSGADFSATSGALAFLAGTATLTQSITVPIAGDDIAEFAESFLVNLTNAQNALVLDGDGVGEIGNDDTTLVIDPKSKGKVATWRDIDGDLVTLKATKGVLSVDDFVFIADGNGGEQLAALLLDDDGAAAAKSGLAVSAKRDALFPQGNGRANVGFIDASGIDLGKVTISGDLGRIEAGDSVLKTPGFAALTVGSMGFFGLTTQAAGGNLTSEIAGNAGAITVRGDFDGARVHASGKVAKLSIAGSLIGGAANFSGSFRADGMIASVFIGGALSGGAGDFTGLIESSAAIGKVTVKAGVTGGARISSGAALGAVSIGGDLSGEDAANPAVVSAQGKIASVRIGGSARFASVLAGFTGNGMAVNPDATIGAVTVTDNWIASNLVAGIQPGADGKFGAGSDDVPATAVLPFGDKAKVFSKIASITIGGYVAGTPGDPADAFAFTAQRIGKLSVGALAYVLNGKQLDTLTLATSGDVKLAEVA